MAHALRQGVDRRLGVAVLLLEAFHASARLVLFLEHLLQCRLRVAYGRLGLGDLVLESRHPFGRLALLHLQHDRPVVQLLVVGLGLEELRLLLFPQRDHLLPDRLGRLLGARSLGTEILYPAVGCLPLVEERFDGRLRVVDGAVGVANLLLESADLVHALHLSTREVEDVAVQGFVLRREPVHLPCQVVYVVLPVGQLVLEQH
mmetsp:Transcript_24818/g.58901  ORF Transcript_24818/g.58901 Transcript_24818/m.58901 type:complete len:203 (-) Transcript_24818:1234-1842(-)